MAEHRWDTGSSAAAADAGSPLPVRRRWLLSFRAAVLAVCLLLGAAAAFAVLRGGTPIEVSSVELDPGAGSTPSGAEDQAPAREDASGDGAAEGSDSAAGAASDNASSGSALAGEGPDAAGPPVLVIHVAGAVLHPGVVRVPGGSRTIDAVDAAGGAAPDADLTAVNLAAALQDGAMVVVPRIGDPPRPLTGAEPPTGSGTGSSADGGGGDAAGSGSGSGTTGLINLNTASLQELDTLPRVGPVIAERIVAWREAHGAFSRPEDLDAVPGIGEAMLASLLPLVTV